MIDAQAVVEAGLAAASRAGADGCIVLIDETSHADVRFALNTTTTNGVRRDRSVTVIAFLNQSAGTAQRSGVVDVEEMVLAALADARQFPAADDAFDLVDAAVTAGSPAAQAFGVPPLETDVSVLSGVLSGLSGAFDRARRRDAVLAGFAEYGISTIYMGSSTGVRLAFSQPTGAVNLVGRTADGSGSAWTGAASIAPPFEQMEEEIWRGLDWSRRQIALEAGRYEVILPPSGVADMMGSLAFYGLGGQDAEDGRTVFSAGHGGTGTGAADSTGGGGGDGGGDGVRGTAAALTRVGDPISAIPFTLYSDPGAAGVECMPFAAAGSSSAEASVFDNGLPLSRTDWIRSGRLAQLRYHRAGAARSGVPAAPYIDNLILRAGSGDSDGDASGADGGSVDDMVARTERGLLLTCLWYIREVDPATMLMTGLTRDGVYVIEDGAVVGAANNFRFNESPVDLLARATEVGTPVRTLARELGEYLNRAIMPPLRIPDFNMSTVSQAS
jgi:predicted Zn-dependent protease